MKHTLIVGKKTDDGYDDPREIQSTALFKFRKQGYEVIPDAYIKGMSDGDADAAADVDQDEDLGKLTVPKLKAIAGELDIDIKGMKKADLIEAIEAARDSADE